MNVRIGSLMLASAFLASCGGGGGSSAIPSHVGSNAPQTVKFTLKIPQLAKQVVRKRMIHGQYVSPSTLGAGLNYSATATTFTDTQLATPDVAIDLSLCTTTTLVTCATNTDGSETFTIVVPIPPGTYTFALTTWDVTPKAGTFTGNELSFALVPLTVVAGSAATSPTFVLNGIPASVSLLEAQNQSHVAETTTGTQIIGNGPVLFYLNAVDADGYAVVGNGAPTFSMSDTSGSFSYAQSASASNQFTVQALQPALQNTAGVTVSYSATGPTGFGTATGSTTFLPVPEMWLTGGNGVVQGYQMTVSGSTASINSQQIDVSPATASATGVVADSAGNIWTEQAPQIQEYNPAAFLNGPTFNSNVFMDSCSDAGLISGMALDPSGNIWFADQMCPASGSGVYAINPSALSSSPVLSLTTSTQPSLLGANSVAIAPNTSGVLAALRNAIIVGTLPTAPGVDILTVSGSTVTDTYPQLPCALTGKQASVAMTTDGILWVYDGTYLNAFALKPSGSTFTCIAAATRVALSPGSSQLAVDPVGQVWIANGTTVSAYTVSGGAIVNSSTGFPGFTPAGIYIAP